MFIIKTQEGTILHSGIKSDDATMMQLDKLGEVTDYIIPNMFHNKDAYWFANRYPKASIHCPQDLVTHLEKKHRINNTLENWQSPYLKALKIDGLRKPEFVFYHPQSETLIVTDAIFNINWQNLKGISKWFSRWNSPQFGPTKIYKIFIKNKIDYNKSIKRILNWNIQNIALCHGELITQDAHNLIESHCLVK